MHTSGPSPQRGPHRLLLVAEHRCDFVAPQGSTLAFKAIDSCRATLGYNSDPLCNGGGPHALQHTVLSPLAPTWHLSGPRTIPRELDPHQGSLTRDPIPALHELELPASTARIGHLSPAHRNPDSDSETDPMPPPTSDNGPKRGPFDYLLLPRGAVRIRLTLAKKRATARRRINKANIQSMLVDHWPKFRPPSLPVTTKIRAYTHPRAVFIPSARDHI